MTLIEFLLARIAEDENGSASLHRIGCNFMIDGLGGAPLDSCDCDGPARVLAECEAKQLLVKYEAQWLHDPLIPTFVLRVLSLPYADHPDYQQEWAP